MGLFQLRRFSDSLRIEGKPGSVQGRGRPRSRGEAVQGAQGVEPSSHGIMQDRIGHLD